MAVTLDKPISLVQATQTLYRTRSPSEEQLDRVFRLMKSGDLPARDGGANRLRWTTTEAALAEFMAENELRRTRHSRKQRERQAADDPHRAAKLQHVYRNIWRDYFLAVMLRKRMSHRSVGFHRAVLAGQAVFLLLLVGTALFSARQIVGLTSSPAEHLAVMRAIEAGTEAYVIERWHPTQPMEDGQGLLVYVEYRYRQKSARWVHTKRFFQVVGGKATEIVLDDD